MPAIGVNENDADKKIRPRKLKNTVFSGFKKKDKESFDNQSSEKLKDPKKNVEHLSAANLFRFADKQDKVLMIIGTICGLALSATQALWLRTYMFIVNSYVEFGIAQANKTNDSDIPGISDFTSRIARKGVSEFVGFGILNVALVIVCSMSWSTAADKQSHRIRRALFQNMMKQEIGWFDATTPGDLLNRLMEDVQSIRTGIGEKIADSFILLSRAIGGIIMAFVSGWKMTLVFICFMPLIGGALTILIVITKRFTVHEIEAFAKSTSIASEVLAGIRTVTAFGGQNKDIKRYELSLDTARRTGIKKGLYIGLCQFLVGVFMFTAFAVLIWYGPLLTRTEPQNYDAGSVMVVFLGVLGGTMNLGTVAPNLQYFMEAKAAAYKIFKIIDRKSQIDVTSNLGYKPHSIYGDINFNNVKFSYPCRETAQILNGLSITIPAGKMTALVGPSGCGKSTVVQLIQRFYDVTDGQVTIDGRNVKDLNLEWLRSQIGIVNQEPALFYGTIEENIRLGKQDATFEEVRRCASLANADDFIMKLPKGYNTLVGEQGTMLSGGQKQRIAIARAIISNPRILLLDEATSALDTESEKIVQRALDTVGRDRTTVAIAHRLSTIRNADVIYVIQKGEVLEKGKHEELMEKKGLYYDLVIAQSTEQKRERAPTIKFLDKRKFRVTSSKVVLDSEEELEDLSEEDEESFFSDRNRRMSSKRMRKGSMPSMPIKCKLTNISKRIRQRMVEMLNDFKIILTIFQYNMKEWPYILAGIVFIAVVAASMPVFVILFTDLFKVFASDPETQVKKSRELAIIVFFVGVATGISSFISSYSLERSGTELTNRMRVRSFAAMVYQDISWFDDDANRVGALLTRLSLDAAELKGMTGQRLSVIIQSLAGVLIALIMCFVCSWKLTLVTLCLLPLIIFSGYIQGESLKKRTVQASSRKKEGSSASLEEEGGKVASETLNNIRTVVSMKKEQVFIDKFNHYFDLQYKSRFLKNLKFAIGNGISQSIIFFMYAVAFGYGAHLVGVGELDFNLVFRVVGLVGTLGMSLGRGSAFLVDFADARESACNVIKLVNQKPSIDARDESGGYIENLEGNIKFQNVHFSYPTRSFLTVLDDLSFTAPAGRSCAFVGQSGCGKSTTISLILRFYDPDAGTVAIDNYDIRDLNIQWLRSIIGFVQQEPVLFNISILDNIKYGLPDNAQFDMADVIRVCKIANIHNDIMGLPMQYETNVGTKGSQLSGGQKQRIAIARALIRNPKILLLDEATSALDTTSEKIVQAALDEAQLGRTTVSIAHRLSTIKDAHQICVVDKGRVIENGNHDTLIKANGLYAKLARAQGSGTK